MALTGLGGAEFSPHAIFVPARAGSPEMLVTNEVWALRPDAAPARLFDLPAPHRSRVAHAPGADVLLSCEHARHRRDLELAGRVLVLPLEPAQSARPADTPSSLHARCAFDLFELIGLPPGAARTCEPPRAERARERRRELGAGAPRAEGDVNAPASMRVPMNVVAVSALAAPAALARACAGAASLVLLATSADHLVLLRLCRARGEAAAAAAVEQGLGPRALASVHVPGPAVRVDVLRSAALGAEHARLTRRAPGAVGARLEHSALALDARGRALAVVGTGSGEVLFFDMAPLLAADGGAPPAAVGAAEAAHAAPPALLRRVRAHGVAVGGGPEVAPEDRGVEQLRWHAHSAHVVTGGADGRLSLCRLPGSEPPPPGAPPQTAADAEPAAHSWLAAGGLGAQPNYMVTSLALARDANVAASASRLQGRVTVWALPSGAPLHRLDPSSGLHGERICGFRIHALALAADGRRVAISHANNGMDNEEPNVVLAQLPPGAVPPE